MPREGRCRHSPRVPPAPLPPQPFQTPAGRAASKSAINQREIGKEAFAKLTLCAHLGLPSRTCSHRSGTLHFQSASEGQGSQNGRRKGGNNHPSTREAPLQCPPLLLLSEHSCSTTEGKPPICVARLSRQASGTPACRSLSTVFSGAPSAVAARSDSSGRRSRDQPVPSYPGPSVKKNERYET